MSKPQTLRTRPGTGDTAPGATTTLVRADPRPLSDKDPELHPHLRAQLRELQLRSGSAQPRGTARGFTGKSGSDPYDHSRT